MKKLFAALTLVAACAQASTVIAPQFCKFKALCTIDRSKNGAVAQANFPALLSAAQLPAVMVTASGASASQADGGDICFTSNGVTQLNLEIVSYTQNANPAIATAQMFVSVPSIAASGDAADTTIWIHWGYRGPNGPAVQPAANATGGSQGVWDANTHAVWHLEAAAGANQLDSTANGYTLTCVGTLTQVAGQVGNAVSNFAATRYETRTVISETGAYTISFIGSITSLAAIISPMGNGEATGNYAQYKIRINTNGGVYAAIVKNSTNYKLWTTANSTVAAGNTYFITVTSDGTCDNGGVLIYVNGTAIGTTPSSTGTPAYPDIANCGPTRIGLNYSGNPWAGWIDEMRMSNTVRSPSWVTASYNNLINPATFWKAVGETQFSPWWNATMGAGSGGF